MNACSKERVVTEDNIDDWVETLPGGMVAGGNKRFNRRLIMMTTWPGIVSYEFMFLHFPQYSPND
ncbi:uncharacterized protein F4817DRAFT_259990 [Daldinia loculata]|uniref:uncharacterized protein n=1 Tax=Daldinia loculata TaxID=103429 RepID=UPI0020C309F8|nr:uncharacterized protein F4817DRAFT_259990 [Daldinia loculata]KAI1650385.1 hypothetical protein F4817DRAFT_259990 [Daldinia loculata]